MAGVGYCTRRDADAGLDSIALSLVKCGGDLQFSFGCSKAVLENYLVSLSAGGDNVKNSPTA